MMNLIDVLTNPKKIGELRLHAAQHLVVGLAVSALVLSLLVCLRCCRAGKAEQTGKCLLRVLLIWSEAVLFVGALLVVLQYAGLHRTRERLAAGLLSGWALSWLAALIWRLAVRKRRAGTAAGLACIGVFSVLLIGGILARTTLLIQKQLAEPRTASATQLRGHPDVYNYEASIIGAAYQEPMNIQRFDLPVYREPSRRAEVIHVIPAETAYYDGDMANLTRGTTHLGWRYVPDYEGYVSTFQLIRCFWNTYNEHLAPNPVRWRVSYDFIFTGDMTAYTNGSIVTADMAFQMWPLDLLACLVGIFAAALETFRAARDRKKRA